MRSRLFAALVISVTVEGTVPAALQQTTAIVIDGIDKDSAAAKAGFQLGDRVISDGGQPLLSPAALQAAEDNTTGHPTAVRCEAGVSDGRPSSIATTRA